MVVAVTLERTADESPLEEFQAKNGSFDAESYRTNEAAVGTLPEGSTTLPVRMGYVRLRVAPGRHIHAEISDLPLTDPRVRGAVELVEGRAPHGAGEMAISPALADELHLGVGDRLDVGPAELHGEVVGLAEQPRCLSCERIVVPRGTELGQAMEESVQVLVDLPPGLSAEELIRLQTEARLSIPALWSTDRGLARSDGQVAWTFVAGGVVLAVMGIVIAAAFAVGARRQLATLGQLSANGAAPATLGAALVLQGTVTGLVGAVAGLGLGWAVLLGGQRWVEVALDRRIDGYAVAPGLLAAAMAAGVLTATIAAALPARTAARIPTLQAMAGRRPLSRVPRRVTLGGIAAVAAGLGLLALAVLGSQGGRFNGTWAGIVVVGGVLELLGACATAPVLVARLEPLSSRLRGTGRLAARSLARQRTRSGAVIAAVCAAGALAVCAGAVVRGVEARDARAGRLPDGVVLAQVFPEAPRPSPDGSLVWVSERPTPAAEQRLADAVPGAQVVPVRVAAGPWEVTPPRSPDTVGSDSEGVAVVADDAVLDAFEVDRDARQELADHGVVVLQPRAQDVEVRLPDGRSWSGRSVVSDTGPEGLSNVLVAPLTARDAGVEVRQAATALRAPGPFTDRERDALTDLLYDETLGNASVDWYTPPSGPSPLQLQLLLSGAALVFSVLVVGASLALAAAESRDERDTLRLAGAPPGTLARTAGAKAALLAELGGVLALPIGFLPVVVFSVVDETGIPLRLPWPAVGALLATVPVVAGVVAWAASGAAQRLRPARISTMAFD
jgi:putative ABC transport system permease protein